MFMYGYKYGDISGQCMSSNYIHVSCFRSQKIISSIGKHMRQLVFLTETKFGSSKIQGCEKTILHLLHNKSVT